MPAQVVTFPFSQHNKQKVETDLTQGKTVIFATETFYALGCNAFLPNSLEQIFRIKRRTASKSLPLLINQTMANQIKNDLLPQGQALASKFWAGAMTLVLPAPKWIPDFLHAPDGSIAVRHSDNQTVSALLDLVKFPLIGTSANLSGQPPHSRFKDLLNLFQDQVDLMIDSGETKGEEASTIVSLMTDQPTILRKGQLTTDIQEFLKHQFGYSK